MNSLRGWNVLSWVVRAMRPYQPADDAVAATFRAKQLQAVLQLAPLTVLANVLNVLLICWAFWSDGVRAMLGCWAAAVMWTVWRSLRSWRRWRRNPDGWQRASTRAIERATVQAALLAALWSVMPLVLFAGADGPHQLLLAAISTGMICAGGFALATAPFAGTAWVAVLGASTAATFLLSHHSLALPLSGLLTVYSLIVIASVWSTAHLFGARLMAEMEAERQNEVIGLLLRDFEENASDVLWEIDASGKLCHVSPRIEHLFGMPATTLKSEPMLCWLRLLVPADAGALEHLADFTACMSREQPFRDAILETTHCGSPRWWHISAKPLRDNAGDCIGWRGVFTNVTEAHHAHRQLSWLAHFDPLTGLANRHQLRTRLEQLLHVSPGGSPIHFALLCIDLDHFKTINDTFGHGAGDALLKEVGQRLMRHTRRTDTVARLGGDEFAVLLHPLLSPAEVPGMAARLIAELMAPCLVQGSHISVGGTIGIALSPVDGQDIDTLLNNADLALYAAKAAGRGKFAFFAPEMAALTRRRLLIEQELVDVLSRNELSLVFQPQVDLLTWSVTGLEALLRWHHPSLGTISPVEFIGVAEDSGMIAAIGAWVLREACRQAARWPGALTVSVNVSPVQAMSKDLHDVVLSALGDAGLHSTRLELEITESIFLNDAKATLEQLHVLRKTGVRIALDDFGTGYSSLAYLRRFPFDTLKIDRGFMRELMERSDARAIVKMTLSLARALKMKTVAEGVEEPMQAGLLAHHGCTTVQGYLIAEPITASGVEMWLTQWSTKPSLPQPESLVTAPAPL